ncbi:MAG TPA: class II aldolase/adducin family protein [Rhizobium sp.]
MHGSISSALDKFDSAERELRADLAATFRMVARADWHESIANHFSVATSADGSRFLMNPKWKHFSLIKASELVHLDANDETTMDRPDAPDATAWYIHGTMHARMPHARCILHVHSPYATTLSCLADPEMKPIDQTSARFFNRVAIDRGFSGMADDLNEGVRLANLLGNRRVLLMGNHGVLVVGASIAQAFDELYHFERAARTLMLAYASGQPLSMLSPEVAESTAQDWEKYDDGAFAHFSEMRRVLDAEGSSYAS